LNSDFDETLMLFLDDLSRSWLERSWNSFWSKKEVVITYQK